MTIKTILITGAAGFVGTHLARHLRQVEPDARLLLVDNFQRGCHDRDFDAVCRDDDVELIMGDCLDFEAVKAWVKRSDEIYHLAAINGTRAFYQRPYEVLRTNTLALQYVLDAIATLDLGEPVPKLLFTSSNEAYAGALEAFDKLPLPTPEGVPLVIANPQNPRWSYGGSKLIGELLCTHAAQYLKVPTVIVRPHNFYGPRAGDAHVIPEMLHRVFSRVDPFPIYGPDETRSFCYIEDAVDAMRRCMALADTQCPVFHIGSPYELQIRDLAEAIFQVCRWRPRELRVHPSPAGSVLRRVPDITKIKDATGWEPTTPLVEGLARTAAWYVSA